MSGISTVRMPLVFAGTPAFAAQALEALLSAGYPVPLVLTQPDRPAGRGMKLLPSPVKALALAHGLRVEQPATLRDPETQAMLAEQIRRSGAQVMVVAAYGLILPQLVLDMPARGCLNIHASLLPRWRGAAPIQRAIEAGDTKSGVGIMQMEAGLDTGPVLLQQTVPITQASTGGSLHDQLAATGAALIVQALNQLDELVPQPQQALGVTYAKKIDKAEMPLDLTLDAANLARKIRAFDPVPGCSAVFDDAVSPSSGAIIKFWAASDELAPTRKPAGEILSADAGGVLIACGSGALRVTELQKAGGKRLPAREFLAGMPLHPGQRFVALAPAAPALS